MVKIGHKDTTSDLFESSWYKNCKYVFLAVNNCDNEESGSHWSLLFIDKDRNHDFHLDSLKGSNNVPALKTATGLNIPISNVFPVNCIQQNNGYECGIHVIVNAKYIFNYFCCAKIDLPFLDWFPNSNIVNESNTRSQSLNVNGNDANSLVTPIKLKKSCSNEKWVLVRNSNPRKLKDKSVVVAVTNLVECKNRFDVLNEVASTDEGNFVKSKSGTWRKSNQNKNNSSNNQSQAKLKKVSVCKNPKPVSSEPLISAKSVPVKKCKKPKVTILSDSHGRHLSDLLRGQCSIKYDVLGFVKPNGKLSSVVNNVDKTLSDMDNNDLLIVFGGTNDISSVPCVDKICNQIDEVLKMSSRTQLVVVGLPLRWDQPELNQQISLVNERISLLVLSYSHAKFLSLDSVFKPVFYTKHGLHFNMLGKKRIVGQLLNLIFPTPCSEPDPIKNIPVHLTTSDTCKNTFYNSRRQNQTQNNVFNKNISQMTHSNNYIPTLNSYTQHYFLGPSPMTQIGM